MYDSSFVSGLFDEMSRSYGTVNVLSSFAFCIRWRRQCLEQIDLTNARRVVDLMSGMGELHRHIEKRCPPDARIESFDISAEMCRLAEEKTSGRKLENRITRADVLTHEFEAASADAVVSSFGLKTFSDAQLTVLAERVAHVLAPGGRFAFLEISTPPSACLRVPFQLYLRFLIPWIGKLFMGNPDNYRMLDVYTRAFGSCERVREPFERAGLCTSLRRFFFGCATGIYGHKAPTGSSPRPA